MSDLDALLASYPRARPPLPEAYRKLYVDEYRANRGGSNPVASLVQWLEGWMHRQVAARAQPGSVLELGAGSLNHLPYETAEVYDVVEPFTALFEDSEHKPRVRRFHAALAEVAPEDVYDRILSVAVLEHLEDLPGEIARAALQLAPGGIFQAGIPCEGGLLWGLAWRLSTGVSFRLRNKLPYKPLMRHEHINAAREIEALVRHFFERVTVRRFPLPGRHLSVYAYLHAEQPRLSLCREFLDGRGG